MTQHLAIRAPERERVSGRWASVIEEHNRTLNDRGEVAFGKVGARIANATIQMLKRQIRDGQTTTLYVIVRTKLGYQAYSAEIADLGHVEGRQPPRNLFPAYYDEAGLAPTTYFILRTSLVETAIDDLLLSRGQSLVEIIPRCRTTQMIVRRREQPISSAA